LGKVLGEAEQHNISEAETGYTQPVDKSSLYPGFLLPEVLETDIGFISYTGQDFCNIPQRGFLLPEYDKGFLFCEIDCYPLYAAIEPVQVFE
jgi:hypothetical protein